jgi:hypothetical protein
MKKKERVPVKKKMKNLFRSPITAAGASILIGQRSPKKKKEKKSSSVNPNPVLPIVAAMY